MPCNKAGKLRLSDRNPLRLICELLLGRPGIYHSLFDLDRHTIQELAARAGRSGYTFAVRRLEICPMRLAHQVTALFCKKLVFDPVHRDWHVAATVDVSVVLTA